MHLRRNRLLVRRVVRLANPDSEILARASAGAGDYGRAADLHLSPYTLGAANCGSTFDRHFGPKMAIA